MDKINLSKSQIPVPHHQRSAPSPSSQSFSPQKRNIGDRKSKNFASTPDRTRDLCITSATHYHLMRVRETWFEAQRRTYCAIEATLGCYRGICKNLFFILIYKSSPILLFNFSQVSQSGATTSYTGLIQRACLFCPECLLTQKLVAPFTDTTIQIILCYS